MKFLVILFLLASAVPALACRFSLANLASVDPKHRPAIVEAAYWGWLHSDSPRLTAHELAALVESPFVLPELEAGRAELRVLLAEIHRAYELLVPAEREPVLSAMKRAAREKSGLDMERDRVRENERVRPVDAYYAYRWASPGRLMLEDWIAGTKTFLTGDNAIGALDLPETHWLPGKTVFKGQGKSILAPGGHWLLRYHGFGNDITPPQWLKNPLAPASASPTDAPLSPTQLKQLTGMNEGFFSADGKRFAARLMDDRVLFYGSDATSPQETPRIQRLLGISPDGERAIAVRHEIEHGPGRLIFVDARGNETPIEIREQSFRSVAYSADGKKTIVVAGDMAGARKKTKVYQIDNITGAVDSATDLDPKAQSAELSPLGTYLLETPDPAVGYKLRLRATGKVVGEIRMADPWPKALFSPDEKQIVFTSHPPGGGGTRVEIYDLDRWIRRGRLQGFNR